MSKITRIEQQKKKKNRVNIYIDGEFSLGLYKDTVVKYHLYENKEISNDEIASIKEFEEITDAKEKIRNYISYRERSRKEVEAYLKSKGIREEIIAGVLTDFEKANLINDHRFALAWIKDRNKINPKGNLALKIELLNKGLEESQIDEILQSVDEKENAYRALEKAFKKYGRKRASREKIFDYLKRRGFDFHIASEILNEQL